MTGELISRNSFNERFFQISPLTWISKRLNPNWHSSIFRSIFKTQKFLKLKNLKRLIWNFSSPTIRCRSSDEVSTLEPSAFSTLSDLEQLTITGCRLEHVPSRAFAGLDRLRSLAINSEHSSFLAVEAGGLAGLPNLEELNLAGNYLRYVRQIHERFPKHCIQNSLKSNSKFKNSYLQNGRSLS